MLTNFLLIILIVFSYCRAMETSESELYDVIINNSRVMDPKIGMDNIRNIDVSDGKIATIFE